MPRPQNLNEEESKLYSQGYYDGRHRKDLRSDNPVYFIGYEDGERPSKFKRGRPATEDEPAVAKGRGRATGRNGKGMKTADLQLAPYCEGYIKGLIYFYETHHGRLAFRGR